MGTSFPSPQSRFSEYSQILRGYARSTKTSLLRSFAGSGDSSSGDSSSVLSEESQDSASTDVISEALSNCFSSVTGNSGQSSSSLFSGSYTSALHEHKSTGMKGRLSMCRPLIRRWRKQHRKLDQAETKDLQPQDSSRRDASSEALSNRFSSGTGNSGQSRCRSSPELDMENTPIELGRQFFALLKKKHHEQHPAKAETCSPRKFHLRRWARNGYGKVKGFPSTLFSKQSDVLSECSSSTHGFRLDTSKGATSVEEKGKPATKNRSNPLRPDYHSPPKEAEIRLQTAEPEINSHSAAADGAIPSDKEEKRPKFTIPRRPLLQKEVGNDVVNAAGVDDGKLYPPEVEQKDGGAREVPHVKNEFDGFDFGFTEQGKPATENRCDSLRSSYHSPPEEAADPELNSDSAAEAVKPIVEHMAVESEERELEPADYDERIRTSNFGFQSPWTESLQEGTTNQKQTVVYPWRSERAYKEAVNVYENRAITNGHEV